MCAKATIAFLLGSFLLPTFDGIAQEKFSVEVLKQPDQHRTFFEETIPIKEISIYQHQEQSQTVLLENGYASHQFKNADVWPPQNGQIAPQEVTIIFTKYPKDKAFWLTDYHWLLARRLEALFQLDPAFNDESVRFSILLQTECDNEFEAMQLFHGIRVKFKPIQTAALTDEDVAESVADRQAATGDNRENRSSAKKIMRFMVKERHYVDSTVYGVLDRNTHWKEATIILDWTGSMYGYGAEAMLWHVLNESRSGIEEVFFFNDGDRKRDRKKRIGNTGGIYQSPAFPVQKPIKLFNRIKKRGDGGDSPENDVEAIITAIKESSSTNEIILVADNQSCVRDLSLLGCIDRPIRVILCGTKQGINHQYLNLAWKTGGSIHTKELDLFDINRQLVDQQLLVEGVPYSLTPDDLLMPTNRFGDNFGYCDRYYRGPKRTKRKRKEPKCYFTK